MIFKVDKSKTVCAVLFINSSGLLAKKKTNFLGFTLVFHSFVAIKRSERPQIKSYLVSDVFK